MLSLLPTLLLQGARLHAQQGMCLQLLRPGAQRMRLHGLQLVLTWAVLTPRCWKTSALREGAAAVEAPAGAGAAVHVHLVLLHAACWLGQVPAAACGRHSRGVCWAQQGGWA